jgi:3-deoxy-7-phosphoheptulonate synthase
MIVAMQESATEEQIQQVLSRMMDIGFKVHRTTGTQQTVLAGVGQPASFDVADFQMLPGVAEAHRITSPYKLAGRGFCPQGTVIRFPNGVQVGGPEVVVMAGPCSVESREQIFAAARVVQAGGAKFLRGGAYKPRSSPYSFQGMGLEGLKLLREVGDATGLLIVTEVMEISQIEKMLPYIDCFQVGARNMQNFNLLRELGFVRKPVLLKRGIAATIEELLLSAEYILSGGNYDVMLCERGIRTFETATRNTMDISAIPVLKHLTHLPVVGDPSHGTGRRDMVPPMARAALAAGCDALIMEVHPHPEKALSDGAQSLFPAQFEQLMHELRMIAPVVGRDIAPAPDLLPSLAAEKSPEPSPELA